MSQSPYVVEVNRQTFNFSVLMMDLPSNNDNSVFCTLPDNWDLTRTEFYVCTGIAPNDQPSFQLSQDKLNNYLDLNSRPNRNALLTACDWTQLPDIALDSDTVQLWKTYRQQLRNLTNVILAGGPLAFPNPPSN